MYTTPFGGIVKEDFPSPKVFEKNIFEDKVLDLLGKLE
jgi:hypothetical protein